MWDVAGNTLKTVHNHRIERTDGIWSVTAMRIVNHKTGHSTDFVVDEADYKTPIAARQFRQSSLGR